MDHYSIHVLRHKYILMFVLLQTHLHFFQKYDLVGKRKTLDDSCICATEFTEFTDQFFVWVVAMRGWSEKNGTKIHWLAPTLPVETVVTGRYAPF
jgi:hypothetical protein